MECFVCKKDRDYFGDMYYARISSLPEKSVLKMRPLPKSFTDENPKVNVCYKCLGWRD